MIIDDFPSLAKTRHGKRLSEALADIEGYGKARFLIRAQFEGTKSWVNGSIEEAFEAVFEKREFRPDGSGLRFPFYDGVRMTDKEEDLDSAYGYSCATVPGRAKRLRALPSSPFRDAALKLIDEIDPLVKAVDGLKGLVGKKPPKEDPVAAYRAPNASRKAAKAVYDALDAVVADNYERLVDHFRTSVARDLDAFRKLQPLSIYDHTVLRDERGRDDGHRPIRTALMALHEPKRGRPQEAERALLRDPKPALRTEYEGLILGWARDSAAAQRQAFLYKNMTKMDSVLDRRADFSGAEILGQSLDLLDARIKVTFGNGDSFVAKTQVVWVHEARQAFTRYPLTFHDVVLNGKRHAAFSEEEMNTVFAPADADVDVAGDTDEADGPRP